MPNIQAAGLSLCRDCSVAEMQSTDQRLNSLDLGPCPTCFLLQLCDLNNSLSLNTTASSAQREVSPLHRGGTGIRVTCCMPRQSWHLVSSRCVCLLKSKLHCLGICLALLLVVSITRERIYFYSQILHFSVTQKCFFKLDISSQWSWCIPCSMPHLHPAPPPAPGRTIISYPFSNRQYHFLINSVVIMQVITLSFCTLQIRESPSCLPFSISNLSPRPH